MTHRCASDPVHVIMASPVVSLAPTQTLRAAAALLDAEDVGAAIVVGEHGLHGVISERDIVRALADGADPDGTPVDAVMSGHALTVGVEVPVGEVADLMLATGVRHIPVVEHRHVVGVVSMRDALAVLRAAQHDTDA